MKKRKRKIKKNKITRKNRNYLENLKKESDYIYRVNAFTAINQNKLGHSQAWKFKPKKIYYWLLILGKILWKH